MNTELARGVGALKSLRLGLGAFEVGQTYFVTTNDQGRLGSLLIQPTSGDSGTTSAVGYFPKNAPVKVTGQTANGKTYVTGNAYSMEDVSIGEKSGWVSNAYLKSSQAGDVWAPQGGGGGGDVPVENVSMTTTDGAAPATDYVPWVLGGVAVLGLGVLGWAALSGKKKGKKHRRLSHA